MERTGPHPEEPPAIPFIVGAPRSGTTLLRLMLDAHSQLAVTSETYFLFAVAKAYWSRNLRTGDQLFEVVTSTPTWNDFGVPKEAYRERLRSLEPFSLAAGLRLFYELYAARFGKHRCADKTPDYTLLLRSIERMLPSASFIHIIRDGRDVVLSLRETWFAPSQDMAALAQFWVDRVSYARKAGADRRRYLEIRYEDLVLHPRETLAQVCQFVDLPFEEQMESHHLAARQRLDELHPHYEPDGTLKVSKEDRLHIHRRSTQPPDPTRIGHWRHEMRPEEQDAFMRTAAPLLEELGYL
jgi:hypothetical protein